METISGNFKNSFNGYLSAVSEFKDNPDCLASLHCGIISEHSREGTVSGRHTILRAAGLALSGRRVFLTSVSDPMFIARGYEQIRAAICVPNLKVVLSSVHDGAELDHDGAVRQMNEDFALMRVLPGIAVLSPSDGRSAYVLTRLLASSWEGPAYMRLSHSETGGIYGGDDFDFSIGGARLLSEGDGVTICAVGVMVKEALIAGEILAAQGISADIIDCYSIKPFAMQTLLASVRRTGCCVTAEKHNNAGGLFGTISECLSRSYPVPAMCVSVDGRFGQSGTEGELREYYGLTHREIVHNALQVWAIRRR
ncbi:MAG: transketolase [Synergistaceae bacterium]|jgi:transketolase|nr:transketolase [Synergistaceae bacterium]